MTRFSGKVAIITGGAVDAACRTRRHHRHGVSCQHPARRWESWIRRREDGLRRLQSPEDIAKAFAFVASDDAAMITGPNLTVDGGAAL